MNISSLPKEARKKQEERVIFLDVRTKEERTIASLEPSLWIPVDELEQRYVELYTKKELIVFCHHGSRSDVAAAFLRSKGFRAVSLEGGIDRWAREIDTTIATY